MEVRRNVEVEDEYVQKRSRNEEGKDARGKWERKHRKHDEACRKKNSK